MRAVISAIKMLLLSIWSLMTILIAIVLYVFFWSPKVCVFLAKYIWAPFVHFVFAIDAKVKGVKNIDKNANYVIMANHSSFLDIPVLFLHLPIRLYFVAKKELKKIPLLGLFISMAGMIFIDRSNRAAATRSLNKAAELINNGRNVVIFPEGTASRDGKIADFKKGGFHLALNSKATILPIRIEGTGRIWPRGKMFNLRPGKVDFIIGKGISYEEYKDKTVGELAAEFKKRIEGLA